MSYFCKTFGQTQDNYNKYRPHADESQSNKQHGYIFLIATSKHGQLQKTDIRIHITESKTKSSQKANYLQLQKCISGIEIAFF